MFHFTYPWKRNLFHVFSSIRIYKTEFLIRFWKLTDVTSIKSLFKWCNKPLLLVSDFISGNVWLFLKLLYKNWVVLGGFPKIRLKRNTLWDQITSIFVTSLCDLFLDKEEPIAVVITSVIALQDFRLQYIFFIQTCMFLKCINFVACYTNPLPKCKTNVRCYAQENNRASGIHCNFEAKQMTEQRCSDYFII
jgi:hypothetical protein